MILGEIIFQTSASCYDVSTVHDIILYLILFKNQMFPSVVEEINILIPSSIYYLIGN